MAFDRPVADRVHSALAGTPGVTGKPLFGGYGVFRNGVMFAGVWRSSLLVKLYAGAADALLEPHTTGFDPMNTGRPMSGWVVVAPPGFAAEEQLADWLTRAVDAIPRAAKRKKKK